ncbi:hypothetical protein ASG40_13260 [Methylobacterium sp. Leaf399]|uniref:hypothetical protein n=1 Tax=Methylobacterium sp. Leaf399 TaxID=1736364 RepID=UPI0006F946AD|nr:hypothetical protein [Methylobacterium sp. Leaf399]KQT07866.1 hypothetical protein ASG40_13260 [Methylobacterium sp. Leaf399]
MPRLSPFPVVLALVLVPVLHHPVAAQAGPRSASDCERLKNDLAYNQCLSMFGPAARNVAGGAAAASEGAASTGTAITAMPPAMPPAVATAGSSADEAAPEARRGRRHRRGSYARGGRQSATFSVGGGENRSYRRFRRRR